jgi:hypothetical protein
MQMIFPQKDLKKAKLIASSSELALILFPSEKTV